MAVQLASAKTSTREGPRATASGEQSLRICLLGYRSHPFSGGQGVYIKYLSKALIEAGHSVDVISGAPYPELDERVGLIRMPSLGLFESEERLSAFRLKFLWNPTELFEWASVMTGGFPEPETFARRAAKYLKARPDDYDIVHDNQCLAYGLLDIEKSGTPLVATIHHPITRDRQIELNAAKNFFYRLLVRRWNSFLHMQGRVIRKLKHVVTVSETSRHDASRGFGVPEEALTVIYNGIDTSEYEPRPNIERNPKRLMATASADAPLKGLRFLLTAYANLLKEDPDLELVVIGEPKPDGETAKLIKKLALDGKITFRRGVTTETVVDLYAEAAIAIVPSLYEGFGLPAGEAMACGVPVISTTGGALPEVVGDAGISVPPGDAQALECAIRDLLRNPALQKTVGEAGKSRIQDLFSWEKVAHELTDYYRGVIEDAHRPV